MSSLSPKDRVSLCSFTFSDGRRCCTPRFANHPRFCPYHAQKEARARASEALGKDLAYFFSGDYLSACDLSTALARLIPAVVRGDVKPKTAHTVAYLVQTLLQTIHISEQEYINALGTDGWRKSIRNSVNDNYDYRFPPAPEPQQSDPPQPQPQPAPPQTEAQPPASAPPSNPPQPAPVSCHSERSEESAFSSRSSLATHHSPLPHAPQPAPSPHTPLPPTSDEFVRHVVAGRNLSRPGRETGGAQAPQPAPASSPTSVSVPPPSPPQPAPVPHPFTSEALPPHVRRRFHRTTTPKHPSPPSNTCSLSPASPQPAPNRDPYALHFDHNCRLRVDSKLL